MKHSKNLEQRTFLQDRFDILIKKQKEGTASFIELTELDEMVNRYAPIRHAILEEMCEHDESSGGSEKKDIAIIPKPHTANILSKIKTLIGRFFLLAVGQRSALLLSCWIKIYPADLEFLVEWEATMAGILNL